MRGNGFADIVVMTHLSSSHQPTGSLPPRSPPVTVHPSLRLLPQSDSFVVLFEALDDLRPKDRPTTEIMAREKFGANVRYPASKLDLSSRILTRVFSLCRLD